MPLDEMTRRNLELVESLRGGGTEGTLLSVLDRTSTPMGARQLRQWVLAPLANRSGVDARLDAGGVARHRPDRARCDARRTGRC
jgi:DNA mismatch repair protein MutS